MILTRRDLLQLLLASALAETVDVEQLVWVPKPIISVPGPPIGLAQFRVEQFVLFLQPLTNLGVKLVQFDLNGVPSWKVEPAKILMG